MSPGVGAGESRIAYIGPDRQLHLVDTSGENARQLTLSLADNPLLRWGQPSLPQAAYLWPSWSPDGRHIACFEVPAGDDVSRPAGLHVIEVDGLRQHELLRLDGRIPIYACWRPDSDGVAVLVQDEEQLELGYCRLDRLGEVRALDQGAPLFFSWAPDGRRVVVHTGGQPGVHPGRVVIRDSQGKLPDEVLPQVPGNYCCPVVVGEHVVHVDHARQTNRLIRTRLDSGEETVLLEFSGLGAVIAAPELGAVAFSAAPKGEGSPYRGITLVDLEGGGRERLTEDDCRAFFWSGPSRQVLYARADPEENCLAWHSVRPGETPSELARCWPSRETLFHLHFFEQFAVSHPLISADGAHLVYSGREEVAGEPATSWGIYVLDLQRRAPARRVAAGNFACFSPRAAPPSS